MATASKPKGADAGILATIRSWTNPRQWSTLFTVAAELVVEREREQASRRDWRDTKWPRQKRTAEGWHEVSDGELPQIADYWRDAELHREAAETLGRQLDEMFGEFSAIRSYLRGHAPTLEFLVPIVNPGIDEPPEPFVKLAERMVRLAGELVAMLGAPIEPDLASESTAVDDDGTRSVKYIGIGLARDGWRLFRNVRGRWDERGKCGVPDGNESKLLGLFREGKGFLTKSTAAKAFARSGKSEKEIIGGPVKAAIAKLRSTVKTNAARVLKTSADRIKTPSSSSALKMQTGGESNAT